MQLAELEARLWSTYKSSLGNWRNWRCFFGMSECLRQLWGFMVSSTCSRSLRFQYHFLKCCHVVFRLPMALQVICRLQCTQTGLFVFIHCFNSLQISLQMFIFCLNLAYAALVMFIRCFNFDQTPLHMFIHCLFLLRADRCKHFIHSCICTESYAKVHSLLLLWTESYANVHTLLLLWTDSAANVHGQLLLKENLHCKSPGPPRKVRRPRQQQQQHKQQQTTTQTMINNTNNNKQQHKQQYKQHQPQHKQQQK